MTAASGGSACHWLPVVVVVTWIVASAVRSDNPAGATLLRVEIPGERVLEDRELQASLAGDVLMVDQAVWGALCNNTVEWKANISLSPPLVVATRSDLSRAAELLATGRFDDNEVARIERHIALEAPAREELVEWVSTWGSATAREYVIARFEEPTRSTLERFVVYATNRSTSDQYLVFADLEQLDHDRVRGVATSLVPGVGAPLWS